MIIATYNVNGIRAAMRKGLATWLQDNRIDVLLLQETRAQEDELTQEIALLKHLGFSMQCWHSARKKGYSGVAILTRNLSGTFDNFCSEEIFFHEARILYFKTADLSIVNVYMPSGSSGQMRQNLKFKFLDFFLSYIQELLKTDEKLIIGGDFNICHTEIDIHNPARHQTSSGFLPEERDWLDRFINSYFIDTFRFFNKDPNKYTWWSYRAGSKAKNLGWRIDYLLASKACEKNLHACKIQPDLSYSDHCPVILELNL